MLTSWNNQSITYDQIGNPLTYRDGMTMTWRNGRELATLTKGVKTLNFTYDPNGLRTKKTVATTSGSTTTTTNVEYIYEGGLLMHMTYGNYVLDFSYDANGTPVGFRAKTTGLDKYYYYGLNSRGDVEALYNADGTLHARYEYDAYGKLLGVKASDGTSITATYAIATLNPLRYRGYVYDNETGLYYLQSRYYDPTTCRFINADGYISTGQGINGYNMFAYCNNNPVMYSDYSGERLIVGCSVEDESDDERAMAIAYQYQTIDITQKLTNEMEENAWYLENMKKDSGYPNAVIIFCEKVKGGGEWDFKVQDEWNLLPNRNYKFYNVTLRYDDPGNINFGYTGAVLFDADFLCFGAGAYQVFTHGFKYGDYTTYFDDYRDNLMIKYGYKLKKGYIYE